MFKRILSVVIFALVLSNCAPSTPSQFYYSVRVQSADTEEWLPNAMVTIDLMDGNLVESKTDNQGFVRIPLAIAYLNQPGRLSVRLGGYELYRQAITLTQDLTREILLTPTKTELTLTPTSGVDTPTQTPSLPNNTPTDLPSPTSKSTPSPTPFPSPLSLPAIITDSRGTVMGLIAAGTFTMGTDPESELDRCNRLYPGGSCKLEDYSNEAPVHQVRLPDFYIDLYEVTNEAYSSCVAANICEQPHHMVSWGTKHYYDDPKYSDYPVIQVDWNQANTYCKWRDARLPTEAEWEKAARGTKSIPYPWGVDRPSDALLNFNNALGDTVAVGSYPNGISPYGIYDMAGNVSEWVADFYDEYDTGYQSSPTGPVNGVIKVLRGGSWKVDGENIRTTNRERATVVDNPYYSADLGFRCAKNP